MGMPAAEAETQGGKQATTGKGSAGSAPKLLILLDVDGTLIINGGLSPCIKRAAEEVLGKYPEGGDSTIMDNTTLYSNVLSLARKAGVLDDNIGQVADEILARATKYLAERLKEAPISPTAGAARLVRELNSRDDVAFGIVTSGSRETLRLKLKSAGMSELLDPDNGIVAVFGDAPGDKVGNISAAIKDAEGRFGTEFGPENVVYVGDQVSDVESGRKLGIRTVGVASGRSEMMDLVASGADAVFENLSDTKTVLETLYAGKVPLKLGKFNAVTVVDLADPNDPAKAYSAPHKAGTVREWDKVSRYEQGSTVDLAGKTPEERQKIMGNTKNGVEDNVKGQDPAKVRDRVARTRGIREIKLGEATDASESSSTLKDVKDLSQKKKKALKL